MFRLFASGLYALQHCAFELFVHSNFLFSDFFRGAIQKFSFCRIFSLHPRGLRSASHPAEEVRAKHQRVLAAAALEARMEEPGHGPSHGWKQVPVSRRSLCKVAHCKRGPANGKLIVLLQHTRINLGTTNALGTNLALKN